MVCNIPIYLHGGQNFDNHLLLKFFPADLKFPMTGLPTSSEKLKCLMYNHYKIIDSFSFLPCSLDKLSRQLVAEKQEKWKMYTSGASLLFCLRRGCWECS